MLKCDSIHLAKRIVTMAPDNDYGIIHDGAIGVKDKKIVFIEQKNNISTELRARIDVIVRDYGNRTLTPALIDCHTHLVFAGNRANEFEMRLQGKSYGDIAKAGGGIRNTVNHTRAASEDDLFQSAIPRLTALMQQGVTHVEIKSGYGLDIKTEMKMLRVAQKLANQFPITISKTYLGAHALPPEFSSYEDYTSFICSEAMPHLHSHNLIDAVDVFCENIAFSLKQTEKIFSKAHELGLPIKCHAEQLSNMGASSLSAAFKALSVDHVEFTEEGDVQNLSEASTAAVLVPSAYYFLQQSQKPPITSFRHHNVPMAVASDSNPGTSPGCSLLIAMNMACVLFGLRPYEALAGTTKHAAKALGLEKERGTLEIGKNADFAVWNIEHPAELSYYLGYNPCNEVIKNGN